MVEAPPVKEVAFSYDFCRKESQTQFQGGKWVNYHPDQRWVWPDSGRVQFVCIVSDPQLVLTNVALQVMREEVSNQSAVVVPVYNSSDISSQIAVLPGVYTTVGSFYEVAGLLSKQPVSCKSISKPYDPGCVMCPAHVFPPGTEFSSYDDFLAQLPESVLVTPRALVHRFRDYGGADRSDLLAWIPEEALDILEIGCGQGWLGRQLQHRPQVRMTGVEINPAFADVISEGYQQVFVLPVEEFSPQERYDCIVCGDVLEHLEDPWGLVKRLSQWLKPGGCLLASVPNAGHWSLVCDLACGRFDYLPYGLTCITHLRWFTEATLREMLEQAGLVVEALELQSPPPTPQGEKFIRMLVENGGADEASLRALGFLVRAVRVK